MSLQVSLDGYRFSEGQFPPSMRIDNRVSRSSQVRRMLMTGLYVRREVTLANRADMLTCSILESSTDAVFLHVTMNSEANKEWGSIFK